MTLSDISLLQALRDTDRFRVLICLVLIIPLVSLFNWIYTTINFYSAANSFPSITRTKPTVPPSLPYAVPWLGNTLSFLDQTPGRFWAALRRRLGNNDACTILLGGVPTYILAGGPEGLFKQSKLTDRNRFDEIVLRQGFGIGKDDFEKFSQTAHNPRAGAKGRMSWQDSLYHEYLLAPSQVDVLTSKFVETFRKELGKLDVSSCCDLISTVRDAMFTASTTAFMGSKVLELCQNWGSDFFIFDADMLKLFYGLPRFLSKDVHAALERLLDAGEKWHAAAQENFDAEAAIDQDWEPWYGCRFLRERQVMYKAAGLSPRGSVSPDIGFLFGLSSNAIPATTWTLCHVLTSNDTTLLPELMAELASAQRTDGTLDISKLIQLPLLNSIYSETLRKYVDVLVTRTLNHSFILPSSHPGHPGYLLEKGNVAMAPSYLSHHDSSFWSTYNPNSNSTTPGPETWHPRRFLHDGKYSTSGTNHKFFPYGGGNHMCPGRTFAKQEILTAIAIVLLSFDVEVRGGNVPGVRKGYNGTGVVGTNQGLEVRMNRRSG